MELSISVKELNSVYFLAQEDPNNPNAKDAYMQFKWWKDVTCQLGNRGSEYGGKGQPF